MNAQAFPPDREIYLRDHLVMAALAMAGAMAILWLMGNAHVWTGAIAGLGAIGFRGWFMRSEELARIWRIEGNRLALDGNRVEIAVPLNQIEAARPILSAVQVITRSGDKHLIKFQKDPAATARTILAARP